MPLAQEHLDRGTHAHAFLSLIFPRQARGYVEIRAKCPRNGIIQRWYALDSLPPLASTLRNQDKCDVWVGTALRAEPGSGAARNCAESWVLFIDADCKGPERAKTFKHQLVAFPLPPTCVISTGSPFSYHSYWRLKAPVRFLTDGGGTDVESSNHYKRIMRGLAQHFQSDPAVHDPARVMRLVGSRNQKATAKGALVQMLKPLHVDAEYPLEAFTPYAIAETPAPPAQPSRNGQGGDGVDLVAEFTERGWMREDQGGEFYYVRCPWAHEHSGFSGASETALWKYGPLWCFKCQHAHCINRKIAEVYAYFRLMRAATIEVR